MADRKDAGTPNSTRSNPPKSNSAQKHGTSPRITNFDALLVPDGWPTCYDYTYEPGEKPHRIFEIIDECDSENHDIEPFHHDLGPLHHDSNYVGIEDITKNNDSSDLKRKFEPETDILSNYIQQLSADDNEKSETFCKRKKSVIHQDEGDYCHGICNQGVLFNRTPFAQVQKGSEVVTMSNPCETSDKNDEIGADYTKIKETGDIEKLLEEKKKLVDVIKFYEEIHEELAAKIERTIKEYETELERLEAQNLRYQDELINLDKAYQYAYNRYKDLKNSTIAQAENEAQLIKVNTELRKALDLTTQRITELMNEVQTVKDRGSNEIAKLHANIRLDAIKISGLEQNIADLNYQNKELTAICHEFLDTHTYI